LINDEYIGKELYLLKNLSQGFAVGKYARDEVSGSGARFVPFRKCG